MGFATVASEGDTIPGAGTILTGTDQKHSINTYDPLNNYGQVVFWANTDQGQVIIRANPPLQPRGQVVAALETVDINRNTGLDAMADGNTNGDMGAVVGTFIASNPQTKATDYEAKIDWGDGSTSPGLLGLTDKVTITQADKVTYDDKGKVTSTTSAGDNVYAIAAHHKYAREGTYVITIYVTDKKDHLGGVGTAIADVINVFSIESPAKYVEVFAGQTLTQLSSHATRGIAGIPSSITTKPADKSFADTALGGSGKYDYSFQLTQDNGNNQGIPNVIVEGHSATLTLASLNTSGNINLDDFNTNDFKVTEYTVSTTATETNNPGPDYQAMITARAGDTFSVTTSSTTTITDAKTYKSANTELSWTHTATTTSTFVREGKHRAHRYRRPGQCPDRSRSQRPGRHAHQPFLGRRLLHDRHRHVHGHDDRDRLRAGQDQSRLPRGPGRDGHADRRPGRLLPDPNRSRSKHRLHPERHFQSSGVFRHRL